MYNINTCNISRFTVYTSTYYTVLSCLLEGTRYTYTENQTEFILESNKLYFFI